MKEVHLYLITENPKSYCFSSVGKQYYKLLCDACGTIIQKDKECYYETSKETKVNSACEKCGYNG